MGEVYEAQHAVVGRRFAIKFLHPFLADNNEIVARFQREAQAAGSLENENIAAIVDAGTADDGAPFLVMEYLEGEDLAHLLVSNGPLPVNRAAYIIIQACRGLAAAHGSDIVHRDLKPENLFVCKRNDGTDQVKVLDFGIAKFHAGAGLTQTGTTMGTPYYMSIEQARGAKEVDLRTDIYALGVILYEILTGSKPHPGDTYNEILYHVIASEPTPLHSVRPGLPPGLAAVIHKAMAREAENRYSSAVDLMKALVPFAGRSVTPLYSQVGLAATSRETASSPLSLPVMPVSLPATRETPKFDSTNDKSVTKSHRTVIASAVGIVCVCLLAGLGIWRGAGRGAWPSFSSQPSVPPSLPSPAPGPSKVVPTLSPPIAAPLPPSVPSPAEEDRKFESPPGRPPERPTGQRLNRRSTPAALRVVEIKVPRTLVPFAQTSDPPEILPSPRGKPVRSIDRKNPFAE
jgi:serine/threonine protein kinase